LAGTGWAQAACLLGTASYGLAFGYMRRFVTGHGYDAPTIAAVQVTLAAVMMLIPAPLILAVTSFTLSPSILMAILILGIFGSGIAYIWNTTIVQKWGAAPASTVTYLSPLVGVVLGILVLSETVSWNQPVGGAITIVGILISQGAIGRRKHSRARAARTRRTRDRPAPPRSADNRTLVPRQPQSASRVQLDHRACRGGLVHLG
jgi:drug/metabolite transporter (DMT)-like permease